MHSATCVLSLSESWTRVHTCVSRVGTWTRASYPSSVYDARLPPARPRTASLNTSTGGLPACLRNRSCSYIHLSNPHPLAYITTCLLTRFSRSVINGISDIVLPTTSRKGIPFLREKRPNHSRIHGYFQDCENRRDRKRRRRRESRTSFKMEAKGRRGCR